MFLILLLFISALSLEGIGTFISVVGLSAAFAADPVILGMAVVLDFCKIIAVSTLAKKWSKLNKAIKTYLIASTIVLMAITSTGVAGYLTNSFQKAMLPNQGNSIVLDNLIKEQTTLQARKQEIDKQIDAVPAAQVRSRRQLIATFKPEENKIDKRLDEITLQLPTLQTSQVKLHTEVGPVMFLSQALGITPEHAVSIVVAMIIFVFDPLSIMFLVTGNNLLNYRDEEKKLKPWLDTTPKSKALQPDDITSTDDQLHQAHIDRGAVKPQVVEPYNVPQVPQLSQADVSRILGDPSKGVMVSVNPPVYMNPRMMIPISPESGVAKSIVEDYTKGFKPGKGSLVTELPKDDAPLSEDLEYFTNKLRENLRIPESYLDAPPVDLGPWPWPKNPDPVVLEPVLDMPYDPLSLEDIYFPNIGGNYLVEVEEPAVDLGPWPFPKNPEGVIFEPVVFEEQTNKLEDWDTVSIPTDILDKVEVEEAIVLKPQQEKLDELLKQFLLDNPNGALTDEERVRLDRALDEIFGSTTAQVTSDEHAEEPVEVKIPVKAETTLNDPELDTLQGANVDFIGEHWINPALLDIYSNKTK